MGFYLRTILSEGYTYTVLLVTLSGFCINKEKVYVTNLSSGICGAPKLLSLDSFRLRLKGMKSL